MARRGDLLRSPGARIIAALALAELAYRLLLKPRRTLEARLGITRRAAAPGSLSSRAPRFPK
ncbi:MAG: hypothetical protein ACLQMH_01520 [Solirubrobacteraceae bacterium]